MNDIINTLNEMKVLQFLEDSLCYLLENFENQLEMLEEQFTVSIHSSEENA